jgi:hypothetical protein
LHTGLREIPSITRRERHAPRTRDRCDLRIKVIDRPTEAAPVDDNSRELASGKAVEREDAAGE